MKEEIKCCNPDEVVALFYDMILGYVIKKVQDKNLAHDIVQEVMGRLMDAYHKNTKVSNMKAWLFQITRNILVDSYRSKKIVLDEFEQVEDVEDEIVENGAADFIIPMIKLLPEKYRDPLYWSDIDGVPQAEIAKRLDISLSAAKMRCQRGRKMLYEMFTQCCEIDYSEDGSFVACHLKDTCDNLLSKVSSLKK
ncbi:sigma-70 family RNA polymerase sigma factor [Halosquirtibacter xylanolyticus]|uniref:sigma-70 family RNA polymerase sigma factor n=1 Tax=Halosquirtibacter xylanolyticus TaxID=3374599 RepID=UPI00374896B3|nr:sigma-70 family RNA polymerase sigma factor [Prolixibacteraceae bacterium]